MKIRQLLEHAFPEIKERNVSRLPKNYHQHADNEQYYKDKPRIMKRREHLGTGAFASTYSTDKNPHDVVKMSRRMTAPEKDTRSDIDGFYYYIKALSDGNDFIAGDSTTNPYYPQFRNIRLYRKGDKMAYTVQVERLSDIAELRAAETAALWRKMFGRDPEGSAGQEAITEQLDYLAHHIEEDDDEHLDKNLRRALTFIRRLSNKNHVGIDIHPGNIMVRRTPYGPQLVITDPLGYRKDYNFTNRTPQQD